MGRMAIGISSSPTSIPAYFIVAERPTHTLARPRRERQLSVGAAMLLLEQYSLVPRAPYFPRRVPIAQKTSASGAGDEILVQGSTRQRAQPG